MAEIHVSVSSDGYAVAEAELTGATADDIRGTIAEARQCGVWRLWAYGKDLESYGFHRDGGYIRLDAKECLPGEPLSP